MEKTKHDDAPKEAPQVDTKGVAVPSNYEQVGKLIQQLMMELDRFSVQFHQNYGKGILLARPSVVVYALAMIEAMKDLMIHKNLITADEWRKQVAAQLREHVVQVAAQDEMERRNALLNAGKGINASALKNQ